jgi:glycyl-tRNA synthetase beta chain
MDTILLEIGTEEIPAGYIGPALYAMKENLSRKLTGARISHQSTRVVGTPRRLTVMVEGVASKQKSITTEVMGPPEKVAFDDSGRPAVAAIKFAEKVGLAVPQLGVRETKKGRYLYAKITDRGVATRTLLKSILPEVIAAIPFSKSMKWGDLHIQFARPIQYIMALFGKQVVSFEIEGIKSGRYTRGHYFMKPAKIKMMHPDAYIDCLLEADVIVDFKKRREAVEKGIQQAAIKAKGKVLPDAHLLDIVTNLIEYPVPVTGRFDKAFLKLPDEILITSMREHQKYFAVVDGNGRLLPAFIAVNNTAAKDMELVTRGHERVLRARLADAQFFFNADIHGHLDDWVQGLKGVLFQAELGTMYDKTIRVQKISEMLAKQVQQTQKQRKGLSKLRETAARAAYLSKADLMSDVVGEFPRLQGVMGRIFADRFKEPRDVPTAIEEHYKPTFSGGPLPKTLTGAVVSIADKIDSICGCFSVGLIPTGASDPYALRRQAIGIIQIMAAYQFTFSISKMIDHSLKQYGLKTPKERIDIQNKVYGFFKKRIGRILVEEGFAKDVVLAVTQISIDVIPGTWRRVKALDDLKTRPDFEPLAIAFKRVVNIIKQADFKKTGGVDEALFQHECEPNLYHAYQKVKDQVGILLKQGVFDRALLQIASLRKPVDAFFDGVMVMSENKKVRQNRLQLLAHIASLFEQIADFSKVS